MKTLSHALLLTGLLTLCSVQAAPEPAAAPAAIKVDIQAQPINDALNEFARQSGLQVFFLASEQSRKIQSSALAGTFTPRQALAKLLENTGLSYEYLDARSVAIRSKTDKQQRQTDADRNEGAGILMAQGGADEAGGEAGTKKTRARRPEGEVEEMLVEGERDKPAPFSTANLDLTRSADDVLPFTVFTARDIELSGVTSLQEFLRKRLPQALDPTVPEEKGGDGTQLSQSSIQMRGWAGSETVFLLNGRRMAPLYAGTAGVTADATPNLRMIPLGSVERIEVLSSSAAAIYGENANAGVINIITRQDFRGGQMTMRYDTPIDVREPRRSVSLSYGMPLGAGFGLRLGAGYSDMKPVEAVDRGNVILDRWVERVLNSGLQNQLIPVYPDFHPINTPSLPLGATPNISTVASQFSFDDFLAGLFGEGTANYTTVPDGYTGDGDISDFQPGVYNLRQSPAAAPYGAVHRDVTVNVGLDKKFSEYWRLTLDYGRAQNSSRGTPDADLRFTSTNPASVNARVPGTAPTNPFGRDVSVVLQDPRILFPTVLNRPKSVTENLSTVLRGRFGEWNGYLDAAWSRNENTSTNDRFYEPAGGWYNALATGAYNPFVDVRTVAPATPEFYLDSTVLRQRRHSESDFYHSGLKASGPLWRLPGGAVQLTAGVDWQRLDRGVSTEVSEYQDAVTYAPRIPIGSDTATDTPLHQPADNIFVLDSYGGYAEASVPLVSGEQNLALVEKLEVFVSQRWNFSSRSGYRADGRPVTYKDDDHVLAYGFSYEPMQGVMFRMSQSGGLRPPGFTDVTPAINSEIFPSDPATFVAFDQARLEWISLPFSAYFSGGNPDITPETNRSVNMGLVLSPSWLRGLRFSADFVRNVRSNAIVSIDAGFLQAREAIFPDRIRRGAPDGHPSGIGPVIFLDTRTMNLAEQSIKSVDFSLTQDWSRVFGGTLVFTARATRNLSIRTQFTADSAPEEQVRKRPLCSLCGADFAQQIAWNGNAQLQWSGKQWGFGWSTRYFDYLLFGSDDDPGFLIAGTDRAPWALEHDLNINYRVPLTARSRSLQWLFSGSSVSLTIGNVFDRAPRFWPAAPVAAPYDSIRGRTLSLGLQRPF